MPFTFAHPAAVVWCTRWRGAEGLLAALVIGSMSPDFEYFLRLTVNASYSHSFQGIFLFCIPVGLVVYVLYQGVVARPLTENLPAAVRARLPEAKGHAGGEPVLLRLVAVPAALGLGALTHLLWDGFTHGNGLFVSNLPALAYEVSGWPVYKFLQHGSTLAGFAIIGWWFYRRPCKTVPARQVPSPQYWMGVATCWLFWLIMLRAWCTFPGPVTWLLAGIDAIFLSLVTVGLWERRKNRPPGKSRNLAV